MKSAISRWPVALFLLLAWWPGFAAEDSPEALVKATTEEVLQVIQQTNDRQKLEQLAEEKVLPHFNFTRMTRMAVGRYWTQAKPEQQKALETQFRQLLVRTYTNALASTRHREARVQLKPSPRGAAGSETTVRTQVTEAGRQPLAIDYQMEKTPAGWKVFDVVVENMSLVTNYRETFANEAGKSGVDGLIKALADKNAAARAGGKQPS